ncbi:MAG: hypothetical protein IPI34_02005 [bacterium]|nr:hypothetical protein [bacterium]
MRSRITFLVLVCALCGALTTVPPAAVAADPAAERVELTAAVQADPGDYAAQWNLARVLIDLGNLEQDSGKKQALFEEAVSHARAAVALEPGDTWGHHYLAASVGKLALTVGGKRKIELSKEVRDEAEKAIACDPNNDRSHHILGRWNREVTHLSPVLKLAAKVVYGGVPQGASDEKAVSEFQEAIRINPRAVNHHLELGITYMEMKQFEAAIAEFETALALPDAESSDPLYKAEARENIRVCEKKVDRQNEKRRH